MLGLITLARDGVSEMELEDLLSLQDDLLDDVYEWWTPPIRRLPPMLVQRVLMSLGSYVVHRGAAGGTVVMSWYHRQFREAAEERYCSDVAAKGLLHRYMAQYFGDLVPFDVKKAKLISNQPISFENNVWYPKSTINFRRCIEAVHHMLLADISFDVGIELELCDIEGICARAKAGMLFTVIDQLVALSESGACKNKPRVDHYIKWLRTSAYSITLYPPSLITSTIYEQPLESSLRAEMDTLLFEKYSFAQASSVYSRVQDDSCWVWGRQIGGQEKFDNIVAVMSDGHTAPISSLCLFADERLLASGSHDNTVRIWEMRTGSCSVVLQGHTDSVYAVVVSKDNCTLYSGSEDTTIRAWDLSSGECKFVMSGHSKEIKTLVKDASGNRLFSGSRDTLVKIWDTSTGICTGTLGGHTATVQKLCLSSDNRSLFSGSDDSSVRCWDISSNGLSGKLQYIVVIRPDLSDLCISSDDRYLFVGSGDGVVRMWDLNLACLAARGSSGTDTGVFVSKEACIMILDGEDHYRKVTALCVSPENNTLYSASRDGTINAWNLKDGSCKATIENYHSECITAMCHSSRGLLVSCSEDKTIRVLDASQGLGDKPTFNCHSEEVNEICMSSDSRTFYTCSKDNTVRCWEVSLDGIGASCKYVFSTGHKGYPYTICLSADNKTLFCNGNWSDTSIRVFDVSSGSSGLFMYSLTDHKKTVKAVCISSDSCTLYTGSQDKTIKIWDVSSKLKGLCKFTLTGHTETIESLCISSNNLTLFSAANDKTVKIWNLSSRTCSQTLMGHTGYVRKLFLSLDDRLLFSGSADKSVRVWKAATPDGGVGIKSKSHDTSSSSSSSSSSSYVCVSVLSSHKGDVTSLCATPDGKILFSGSNDHTIKLWDTTTGACFNTFMGHNAAVNSLVIIHGGRSLLSCSSDSTIRFWSKSILGVEAGIELGKVGTVTI